MAGDFSMQVVALVAEQFDVVDFHCQQMAAAVGQPTDPVAVGAGGGDALVEGVVLVLPDGNMTGFVEVQVQVQVLVFAGVVARSIVKPLQFAGRVVGQQQVGAGQLGLDTGAIPGAAKAGLALLELADQAVHVSHGLAALKEGQCRGFVQQGGEVGIGGLTDQFNV